MLRDGIIDFPGELSAGVYELVDLLGLGALPTWHVFGTVYLLIGLFLVYARTRNSAIGWDMRHKDFPFILAISLLLFILRLPNLALPEQNSDESQLIIGAATLVRDFRPWGAVDGTTSGPLNIAPLTLIYYLGGSLNYASIRLFTTLFFIIPTCIFFYYTLKITFDSVRAKLLTLPLPMVFSWQVHSDFIAYNSETVPMVLTAMALLIGTCVIQQRKQSVALLLLLGFVLGVAPYTKLQAVPIFLFIGIFFCIRLFIEKKWQLLAAFAFSSMIPTMLVSYYLVRYNLLHDFFESYIRTNLWYATYDHTGEAVHSLFDRIPTLFSLLSSNLASLSSIIAVTIVALVITVIMICRREAARFRRDFLFGFYLITGVGAVLAVVVPGNHFEHYLYFLVVPLGVVSSYLIGQYCLLYLNGEKAARNRWFDLTLVSAILFYPFISSLLYGNPGIDYVRSNTPLTPSAVAVLLSSHANSEKRMALWGFEPRYFIESGLIQGTREGTSYHQMFNANQANYYWSRFIGDLEENKPGLFVDVTSPENYHYSSRDVRYEAFPLIQKYIEQKYYLAESIDGVRIFLRK